MHEMATVDPSAIMTDISRGTNKLYTLVQQKRRNSKAAEVLRSQVFALEQHMAQHHGKGKDIKKNMSKDIYSSIVSDLNSIKLNMNSMSNMSSSFFRGDIQAPEIKEQMDDMIKMIELIKIRLDNVGMSSNMIKNVMEVFHAKTKDLAIVFRSMLQGTLEQLSETDRENIELLSKLIGMVEEHKQKVTYYDEDGNVAPGSGPAPVQANGDGTNGSTASTDDTTPESADADFSEEREMEVFSRVPEAALQLMSELTKPAGGGGKILLSLQEKVRSLWGAWQVEKSDITYDLDEDGEKVLLGRSATSDVFAGFLKCRDGSQFPVAVKSVLMRKSNTPDMLRQVFLHLLAQHNAIVTLYGMWYPMKQRKKNSKSALIILERMSCTVEDAIEDEIEFDRKVVLRDVAAAVTHLHEKGIIHRDLKPSNILLNDDKTRAKLSDFGCSRRRSNNVVTATTMRVGTQLYMAPEVLHNIHCKMSCAWDVWSFGIIICELFHLEGRNAYLDAQHNDARNAASVWAGGIGEDHLRHVARWCLRGEPDERAAMEVVYLHLTGVLSVSDMPVPVPSQHIEGKDWKGLWRVKNGTSTSQNVEVQIKNRSDTAVALFRVLRDGQLHRALEVEPHGTGRITKTEAEGGVFFVLRDEGTHVIRAAFVTKHEGRIIAIGSSYIHFRGWPEHNEANRGGTPWPMRSAASSKQVPLTLLNNSGDDFRIHEVDLSGGEETHLPKFEQYTEWSGLTPGGSVHIFRRNWPGYSFDGSFVYAVCVPHDTTDFTVSVDQFDKLK